MARRHDRIAEIWIYLRLESGEEYQAPIQPDLLITNTDGRSFSAKGFYFEVLEPLRRVRIGFNGQLRYIFVITGSFKFVRFIIITSVKSSLKNIFSPTIIFLMYF